MHVGIRRRRDVEVDDVRDPLDIESPRGDVGRDQDIGFAVAETPQHAIALFLGEPAVQGFRTVPACAERLGEFVDFDAGAAEDDRRRLVFHIEHAREGRGFVAALHDVCAFAHARRLARRCFLVGDRDAHGIVQVALRDAENALRHRRGEECGLADRREFGEQRFEFVGEAHVEHLVGFVEDHRFDGVESQFSASGEIERASRRRDDDVDAALQRAQLLYDRLAAVDGQHAYVERTPVLVHGFRDLHREFARRDDDEAANAAFPIARALSDAVQERQRECGGLARSRRRLAEHVAAGEQRRNRLALNRRGFFVAESR